jgi:hypothetical protein
VKIEFEGFYTAAEYELLSGFFSAYATACKLREAEHQTLMASQSGAMLGAGTLTRQFGENAPVPPEAVEEAPKRTRRTKAQIEAEKAAGAKPNISSGAEDREDPETIDSADESDVFDEDGDAEVEDDLIDGYAVTDAGLVAVMKAYVAKFDMAAAQTNAKTLFGGFTKRSEVTAAGEAAIATAIRNFSNAVNTGKEA